MADTDTTEPATEPVTEPAPHVPVRVPSNSRLAEAGTDRLMGLLAQVGTECNTAEKALEKRRADRLRIMLELEKRGVAYRLMGRTAQISDVAVLGVIKRHHARVTPA
jgi:hypothetical protein